MKLNQLTLRQALTGIKKKKFTGREVFQACLAESQAQNSTLHAYLSLFDEQACQDYKKPFYGLPLALKDNFCLQDEVTTAGSRVLAHFRPPYQATVVQKLRQSGFSFLGKTNLDAWAHGSSTETSDFGPSKNSRNHLYAPGGSSGGSASAVAGDLCLASLGSETGGSIRQPASWCGCVGFRPSYGRASRYGVVAMASSTDTAGFLTKTVADSALLMPLICGHDSLDATTLKSILPDLSQFLSTDLKGKKIGFLYLDLPGLESIRPYYEQVRRDLEQLGAQVELTQSRSPQEAVAVYTVLQRCEVSSNLGRYDGVRYGESRDKMGAEAQRRIILGTFLLRQKQTRNYYEQALKVRTLWLQDFARLFAQYDVLISPTSPTFAKKLGCSQKEALFGELEDILVEPSAICGLPSMSVPCYHDRETNLYLGLNIMAPVTREDLVVSVASAYEHHTAWNQWASAEREQHDL